MNHGGPPICDSRYWYALCGTRTINRLVHAMEDGHTNALKLSLKSMDYHIAYSISRY